jgi:hypothetical protein
MAKQLSLFDSRYQPRLANPAKPKDRSGGKAVLSVATPVGMQPVTVLFVVGDLFVHPRVGGGGYTVSERTTGLAARNFFTEADAKRFAMEIHAKHADALRVIVAGQVKRGDRYALRDDAKTTAAARRLLTFVSTWTAKDEIIKWSTPNHDEGKDGGVYQTGKAASRGYTIIRGKASKVWGKDAGKRTYSVRSPESGHSPFFTIAEAHEWAERDANEWFQRKTGRAAHAPAKPSAQKPKVVPKSKPYATELVTALGREKAEAFASARAIASRLPFWVEVYAFVLGAAR